MFVNLLKVLIRAAFSQAVAEIAEEEGFPQDAEKIRAMEHDQKRANSLGANWLFRKPEEPKQLPAPDVAIAAVEVGHSEIEAEVKPEPEFKILPLPAPAMPAAAQMTEAPPVQEEQELLAPKMSSTQIKALMKFVDACGSGYKPVNILTKAKEKGLCPKTLGLKEFNRIKKDWQENQPATDESGVD